MQNHNVGNFAFNYHYKTADCGKDAALQKVYNVKVVVCEQLKAWYFLQLS